MTGIVVVGGGISGLATAWFLLRRGLPVTVLEARGEPGGNMRTVARDGFLIDTGPTSTLLRGGALGELISGLRLDAEVVEADRRAARYIVKHERLIPLPSGPLSFLTTPLFSGAAKLRLLAEPFRARAPQEESIAQFVRRRIGPEFLDWAVDPFVSGVYAGDPERLSVRAAIPRLYALEAEHGSLFGGALARVFADRSRRPPRGRSISFRSGMHTLARAAATSLGGALRLNAPVTAIERMPNGEWFVRTPSEPYRASHVVLALPAYDAARLLTHVSGALALDLASIAYPPVASIALGFERAQVAHSLDGFGALFPQRVERDTLGVIFSSSLFPGRAAPGKVLLTAFIGGARNVAIVDSTEAVLCGRVLADLRPLLGISGDPILQHVSLWPQAIPQYELGHGERVRRIDHALRHLPGLSLRANWRDGVSLADSVEAARRLALQLSEALGR